MGEAMLYDMTDGSLTRVSGTTFKEEKVLERTHLQAAVRDNVEVLAPGLMVVAEEFGDFEDTHRRIDLLCIDKTSRLVVVELKRTEDGGHMELQALRYAAMVSVMTFEELVTTYARFRQQTDKGDNDRDEARAELLDWIDEVEDDEPVVSREVSIILAAANFSQEITTTVLWLNEFYSTDIRCVRLSPYRHEGRLLLDVQQVIPLPEAKELMVRLRRREIQARAAKTTSGADWTQYVVRYPGGQTEPLRKRRAILAMVHALSSAGVAGGLIATAVPHDKFRKVPGTLEGEQLAAAFMTTHLRSAENLRRWFLDEPVHEGDQTWVLSKQWGTQTEAVLEALAKLAPGFEFHADRVTDESAQT
ncbi:hypothetical protein [Nocardioides houyundeii]|uniref:hypothetical protein n=1 Tax=Nocardioides houyundeii TaxID=2045452 RepID=UPI0013B37366|nr:hypothetical protein [Nocardioides houyundeii]